MAYRPQTPFNVPMLLYSTKYETINGVRKKTTSENSKLFYGTFKTYGGTERESNGIYVVEDTANVETWFDPDIKSGCKIALANNPDAVYEIVGEPENIDMRNQFLLFKVTRIKGGA